MKERFSIRDLTTMAICVAFCSVTAYISFPLPFTPGLVTAVTIAMSLTAFILPPDKTFIVILVYILLGAIGLPVFAGGASGTSRLIGATGGFYLAWLIAYPLVSKFRGKIPDIRRYTLIDILISMPITYLGGMISLMIFMEIDFFKAFMIGALPYVIGDSIKCFFAAFLAVRIHKRIH